MKRIINGVISSFASFFVIFAFVFYLTEEHYLTGEMMVAYKATAVTCFIAFVCGLLVKEKPPVYPLLFGVFVGISAGIALFYITIFDLKLF